jgi:hypothetical protein
VTPPRGSFPRPPKPKSSSPAERSVEFADHQRKLKEDAAKRRQESADSETPTRPKTTGSRSRTG